MGQTTCAKSNLPIQNREMREALHGNDNENSLFYQSHNSLKLSSKLY